MTLIIFDVNGTQESSLLLLLSFKKLSANIITVYILQKKCINKQYQIAKSCINVM